MVEPPQQRRDRHVEHGELLAQHEFLPGEHRRDLGQVVADDGAALVALSLRALLDHLDIAEQLVLEAKQEQARAGPHHGIGGHQLRVREYILNP